MAAILHLHQVLNIAAQLRACHRDPYRIPLLLLGLMTPLAPNGNPAGTDNATRRTRGKAPRATRTENTT